MATAQFATAEEMIMASNGLEMDVEIATEADIVTARRAVRNVAVAMGFHITDVTRIVTATSALARNIYLHASSGIMHLKGIHVGNKTGLELRFRDNGPGIARIEQAMAVRPTGGGLPGTQRLMDEFKIESEVGKGTTVTVRKWLKGP
jgi:serine/threonine-protein kinase RsbT